MRLLLAVLAGVVLAFAFSPFDLWPIAFVSLGTLFFLVKEEKPKRCFVIGWWFSVGYLGFGISWIYNSVHDFGNAAPPLAVLVTLLLVVMLALFPGVALWGAAHLRSRSAILNCLVFASVWTLQELWRNFYLGGFPWLLVGYTQTDSVFRAFAPFIGVYGIGWIVSLFSSLLVVALFKRFTTVSAPVITEVGVDVDADRTVAGREQAPQRGRRTQILAVVIAVVLPLLGWLLLSVEHSTEKNKDVRFRLVQGNIPQELKFSEERLVNSLQTYIRLSRDKPNDVDVVVWPETAIPTTFQRVEGVIGPFAESMLEKGTEVLSGGFYREGESAYNAVRQLGGEKALYTKGHLVPFGEYVPFRFILDIMANFMFIPTSDMTKGSGPANLIEIKGEKLGLSICYEDVFGEEMAESFPGATILVNVSNDAWFGERIAPYQHQQMARMRAMEFERPLMRVTNTGVTSAISHKGKIVQSIAHSEEGYFDIDVTPRTGATPYSAVKNYPVGALALLIVLIAYGFKWSARRQTVTPEPAEAVEVVSDPD